MANRRILVIDDEKDLVDLMIIRLGSLGYDIIPSYNGQEGIQKAEKEKPDLILLDVMMPGLDGFGVLRRLKENPATKFIPVVMLTCKGESDSIFRAEALGSTDYLVKPCESAELLKVIKRYIV